MGLQMPQPVEVGTMIYVETDDLLAAGQILHCRSLPDSQFAAGVELTDVLFGEKKSDISWHAKRANWLKSIWRTMTA